MKNPINLSFAQAVCGIGFLICILLWPPSLRADSIVNSVHNLSANGPGNIKAESEKNVCIFCHTAHHASGVTPLWNHNMSAVSNYVVYSSARLDSLNVTIPQPNGSSRLCLSCHDGTVALGSIGSGKTIQMQNGVTTMPSSANNLGTDLSADHPVSFVYDAALAARDTAVVSPSALTGKVRLDAQSRLQCTSCHDPHDNQYGKFLVMQNNNSALCLACHNEPAWNTSAHAISPQALTANVSAKTAKSANSITPAKATVNSKANTVAANGCENCHLPHRADSSRNLLRSASPEQNCLNCHNGVIVKKDLAADFNKPSIHPIMLNADAHTSVENPVNPGVRHVSCADCHNSHAANAQPAVGMNVSGALAGLAGVSSAGGVVKPLQKEYELCFRCHADSNNRGQAAVTRQVIQTNTRLDFSVNNQSYHPVVAVGKNLNSVPSLISPWTVNSQMKCTDCHNSDTSPAAGGFGANGPHGSIYAPILERNLTTSDYQSESPSAYALCYKCHSRTSILSDQSFKFHNKHITEDMTACTTCHDSHGVVNAPHLINFNSTYVKPLNGQLKYTSTGMLHGTCTLTCHGKDHQATAY